MDGSTGMGRLIQIVLGVVLAGGAAILVYFMLLTPSDESVTEPPLLATQAQSAVANDTGVMAVSPQPTLSLEQLTPAATPTPLVEAAESTPTPSPTQPITLDGNPLVDLSANLQRVGWVSKDRAGETVASFPDYNIYAGFHDGALYLGAASFDLTGLDAYGPILSGDLVLVGLTDERQDAQSGGWVVEVLAEDRNFWLRPGYELLAEAPVEIRLTELSGADLAVDLVVSIPLPAETVQLLNGLRYQKRSFTIRLRGPSEGDSLFGFDGGTGGGSRGNPPRLLLATGPVVPTPTPQIVTATPTPAGVLTAAALLAEATAGAERVGTATPTPFNQVVVAPNAVVPQEFWNDAQGTPLPVIVLTEVPANLSTAVADLKIATAQALTTGTATPLPDRYVTATPTPTPMEIVATTTPENVMTLAAALVQATALAESQGTPTPLPDPHRIITPTPRFIVVTPTPWPANVATAQVLSAQATVQFLLTGTPTPTPVNQVTVTPLSLLIPVSYFTPTPTPIPTLRTPDSIPAQLSGLILFFSDRTGQQELYALDPGSGLVYSVTQQWPYSLAQANLGLAPDGRFRALVAPDDARVLQIKVYSYEYGDTKQITTFKGTSYDPAWSPQGGYIALVTTDPGNDEIYLVTPDGSQSVRLTFNSWEWDKHPSWSPDGQQIVFWSNRETGRRQLWLMNADGSGQRNLSNNEYNDWDPIWIR